MSDLDLVILNGSKKVGTFRAFHTDTLKVTEVRIFRHLVRDYRTKVYHLMSVQSELDSFGCEEIQFTYMDFGYGHLVFPKDGEPDGEYLKFDVGRFVERERGQVKKMVEEWEKKPDEWVLPPCY